MLDIFYSVPLILTSYFKKDFNPILKSKNFYAIKFALWLGADVNHVYKALMLAATRGHTEIVKLFLDVEGINVNQVDQIGFTALMWAATNGHTELVKLFLDVEGINVNQDTKGAGTALTWAADNGYTEIVKLFLDVEGINVNQVDQIGFTALMWAATRGHTEIVKLFLDVEGINVNQVDRFGKTALMLAATNGHTEIVTLLTFEGDPFLIDNKLFRDPEVIQLNINAQTAWNKIFNGIVPNDNSEYIEALTQIFAMKQSYKISLKFFRGSLGLSEKEKSFMSGEYFNKVTLEKLSDLSKSLELHFFKNLPYDQNYHVLTYLNINDFKKLDIVFKGTKVTKSSALLSPQVEYVLEGTKVTKSSALLSPQVEYVLGSVALKPLVKCTVSYVDDLYHNYLKVDRPSYGECLQHGYFSTAGLLENLSAPFLFSLVPIFLNICGWPSIGSQDNYKFLEVLNSKIPSAFIKSMASTVILEGLPLVGEIFLDRLKYVGDSIYCSVIDCTLD